MRTRDADFYRRKAAMADLIKLAGGQARAGDFVGLSQQMMSRICQRDDGSMLAGDAKLALEREVGAPLLTAVEAEMLGYRLVPIGPEAVPPGCPIDAHGQVMIEVSELCRTFGEAWRDRKYSATDAALVDRDIADLQRRLEAFRRINAAILAGEGGS